MTTTDPKTLIPILRWCMKHAPDADDAAMHALVDLVTECALCRDLRRLGEQDPRRHDPLATAEAVLQRLDNEILQPLTAAATKPFAAPKEKYVDRPELFTAPPAPKDPARFTKPQPPKPKQRTRGATLSKFEERECVPLLEDLYPGHYFIHVPSGLVVAKCQTPHGTYYQVKQPVGVSTRVRHQLADHGVGTAMRISKDWRYSLGGKAVTGVDTTAISVTLGELWREVGRLLNGSLQVEPKGDR